MPRTRKEVRRKTVLTKNGRLAIVVYMRERRKKGGIDYYTEAYDTNAERMTDISTQEHFPASSRCLENEVIERVIARTIEKYEAKAFIQRDKIDYATAFATIPEEYHRSLFKSAWGSSVRKAAKSFFTNYSTTIIQTILDAPVITPEVLQEAQEKLLEIVKANQKDRKKLTSLLNTANCTDQNVLATQARLDAAAKITASRRIDQLNSIYQESRLLLPQYNLPLIQIPHLNLDKYIPLEQCKALPLEFIVQ